MEKTKSYHHLLIWQRSHELVKMVYEATKTFPKEEMFGLVSQMRRAAVSVPANIVEGQARDTKKEFLRFLFISRGSLTELEYYFELSLDLGYLIKEKYDTIESLRHEIGFLLHKFILAKQKV